MIHTITKVRDIKFRVMSFIVENGKIRYNEYLRLSVDTFEDALKLRDKAILELPELNWYIITDIKETVTESIT